MCLLAVRMGNFFEFTSRSDDEFICRKCCDSLNSVWRQHEEAVCNGEEGLYYKGNEYLIQYLTKRNSKFLSLCDHDHL